MTQFNPQQQLAIDALGKNIMVSASAGAGKTTVLIARLMKRILQDGVRLDEIVAMTFTEKAAAEMKTRLLEALNEENTVRPTPFLQEQIALVETAHITTIHSFCLTIIKNYGYVLGISPKRATTILDDAGVALLRNKAMDSVLNTWLEAKPDETQRLLDIFSANPLDTNGLRNAVLKSASWLGEKKDPNAAVQEVIQSYQAKDFSELPLTTQTGFFNMMIERIALLNTSIQALIQIIDNEYDPEDKITQQREGLLEVYENLMTIQKEFEDGKMESYHTLLQVLDFKTKSSTNPNYKAVRDDISNRIKLLVSNLRPMEEHFKILNHQAVDIQNLMSLTQDFAKAYQDIKIKEEAFDFSDFEVYALAILNANEQAVAKEFQNQFKEIMVDEFQDTNEYQDEIVRLISTNKNVFRVGDVKQSIYRFRGAKPHIMQHLIEVKDGENLFLSFNYRSKKHIVDYNNDVFTNLMNLTTGIQYDENDHVKTGIPSQEENSQPVEFHIVERGEGRHDDNANMQKARYIAQQIIDHNQQGHRFKDMVVLIRSHSAKVFLKRAFEEVNIPHYIDAQSGFYQSNIIMDVRAFLNFIHTPNDYYLVQILKSPFIGYTDDQLALLRLEGKGSLMKLLKTYDPSIHESLKALMQSWKFKDLVSIITELINYNDTYEENLDLLDKTNLDFLLEKAINYQKQFGSSVIGFLEFMKPMDEISSNEASALSDDADVIRAFTIHQSKGLQFPIVFFWTFGSDSVIDHHQVLVHDDVYGLGLDHIELPYRIRTRNLIRDIVESKQNNEELEENLRLLYVALTRPQSKLIVVDVLKEFNQEPLTLNLLHNHKHKSELLYAASPITTILKVIQADDITTKTFPQQQGHSINSRFTLKFEHEPKEQVLFTNEPLDLNKYSRAGMAYGTVLHEAIDGLPDRTWTPEDLKDIPNSYHAKLMQYNQNEFTQHLYSFEEKYHEMPFTNLDGEGIIDFYAIKDNNIIIVDFKTDNADIPTLIERYNDQLTGYIEVIRTMYPNHHVETYIYSFYNDQFIEIK